ncbi:MAG: HEAT repeat domain-containing protein [Ktedonobacterales bacterium]
MPLVSGSPNLEQLKNQAKDLLRAVRAADPHAQSRVAAHLPHLVGLSPTHVDNPAVRLSHALLVIAQENGFSSWPKLKASVLAVNEQTAREQPTEMSIGASRMLPPSGQPVRAARAQALGELARELTDLAVAKEVTGLARRFSRLPLRDILAVRALIVARGEHPLLVDGLLEGLKSAHPRVRYDCAHALDHFADDRCVGPLRQLVDDPVPRVRRMALHVLSCDVCKLAPLPADDDLVALVIDRALADPSIQVRRHATVALGGHRDTRVEQVLETLATQETDPAIRREARQAVRRHRARASA